MDNQEIKGKAEQAKGYIKQKAGEFTNDPELEAEGAAERAVGHLREGVGKAKRKMEDAIEEESD